MTSFTKRSLLRSLHLYWRVSRGLTLGVRAVVLDAHGGVCLVRHTYLPGWHLPGGGVEAGETALDALARELEEEASLGLDPDRPPRLHGIFHNTVVTSRDHVLVYVVRDFGDHGPKAPDREIVEARFFPLAALPPETTRATRARLREVAEDRPPGAAW